MTIRVWSGTDVRDQLARYAAAKPLLNIVGEQEY